MYFYFIPCVESVTRGGRREFLKKEWTHFYIIHRDFPSARKAALRYSMSLRYEELLLDSTARPQVRRSRRIGRAAFFTSPSLKTSGPRLTMSNSFHSNNFRQIVDFRRDDLQYTNPSNDLKMISQGETGMEF